MGGPPKTAAFPFGFPLKPPNGSDIYHLGTAMCQLGHVDNLPFCHNKMGHSHYVITVTGIAPVLRGTKSTRMAPFGKRLIPIFSAASSVPTRLLSNYVVKYACTVYLYMHVCPMKIQICVCIVPVQASFGTCRYTDVSHTHGREYMHLTMADSMWMANTVSISRSLPIYIYIYIYTPPQLTSRWCSGSDWDKLITIASF